MQEHPTIREICRFLEHEIARTLPEIYPEWADGAINECEIKICSTGLEYRLMPRLWNFSIEYFAFLALFKLGLDIPCHTMGDIADGKMGLIPIESIRRYGATHKHQILTWLASGQNSNIIVDKKSVARLEKVFDALAKRYDGGAA
jgi:hypothetical protein